MRHTFNAESDYPYKQSNIFIWMAFVICVSLITTMTIWRNNIEFIKAKNEHIFAGVVSENRTALFALLGSYEKVLVNASAFFIKNNKQNISRDVWHDYVYHLNLAQYYPGIQGVGWIKKTQADDLSEFIESQRVIFPSFKPYPETDFSEKFIITYIEPYQQNREAVGLDVAFERHRREAANLAIETGETTITKIIQLVQDDLNQPGFLIYRPLYEGVDVPATKEERKTKGAGWIYAPFIGANFIKSVENPLGHYIELKVYDGDAPREQRLIFDTQSEHPDRVHTGQFSYQQTVTVMQQDWTLVWTSTPEFEYAMESSEPDLILLVGLSLTIFLGIIFYVISRRAQVVRQLVQEKTEQIYKNRELLHENEEMFRSAMEHSPSGMALLYPDGRWLKVNKRLCDLFGYTKADLLSISYQSLFSADALSAYQEQVRALKNGKNKFFELELECIDKQGQAVWIIANVALIRDPEGGERFFILQVNDRTKTRELDQMKEDFITIVSHELRTPITSLELSLSLLKDDVMPKMKSESVKLLEMAMRNSRRLMSLVNDIMDLNKLSNKTLSYDVQTHNVTSLIRQAIKENKAYGDKYGVTYRHKGGKNDMHIRCDDDRMLQVLSNFMSNAAKFSGESKIVDLYAEDMGEFVRINVKDRGVGIPEQYHSNIFKKFGQVVSTQNKKIEGTGLGLHISQELVIATGGQIGFESQENKGSIFWCEFPKAL